MSNAGDMAIGMIRRLTNRVIALEKEVADLKKEKLKH